MRAPPSMRRLRAQGRGSGLHVVGNDHAEALDFRFDGRIAGPSGDRLDREVRATKVGREIGQGQEVERVGVMGASQGPVGTARSQYHLRQNLNGLEAITMPKPEIFVASADTKFANGKLMDEATRKVIATWLNAFKNWVAKKP